MVNNQKIGDTKRGIMNDEVRRRLRLLRRLWLRRQQRVSRGFRVKEPFA